MKKLQTKSEPIPLLTPPQTDFERRVAEASGFVQLPSGQWRSEEHTSELQSQSNLVCRLLLEKKKHECCSFRSGCVAVHRRYFHRMYDERITRGTPYAATGVLARASSFTTKLWFVCFDGDKSS